VETRYICWGTGFADFDNNGWPDLAVVTGSVYPELEAHFSQYPLKTPRLIFRNLGNGKFEDNKAIFSERETIADGLGPTYNDTACVECHQSVDVGAFSQAMEFRAGHITNGQFVDAPGGQLIHARGEFPLWLGGVFQVHPLQFPMGNLFSFGLARW